MRHKMELPPDDDREPLSTAEAAKYLGITPHTLRRYRWAGRGPVFYRYSRGTHRYRIVDLEDWMSQRRCDPHEGGRR